MAACVIDAKTRQNTYAYQTELVLDLKACVATQVSGSTHGDLAIGDRVSRKLAILLFDEAEVLDFCGPYEVFSVAGSQSDSRYFDVYTVAEKSPIRARNGLSVNPDHLLADAPKPDILLVPGGYGTRQQVDNPILIDWIRTTSADAELVLSVCTGSILLAKAGLLQGLEATTHHLVLDMLRDLMPTGTVRDDQRFIDNGKVITSAGIAAGIDMSFHVVSRLAGESVAASTAKYMEYPWSP